MLSFKLSVGNSIIDQTVRLTEGSRRLDFVTKADWRESHRMLRVAFPVEIVADQASFDIQYGHVRRPTHRNTSWDLARFEVAGHKYADLSEPDYGVALLNDSKYGYKIHDNVLDLCLLRSPTYPDPDADRGEQTFTYSLLPHPGDLTRSEVMAEATHLNQPPLMFVGHGADDLRLPVRCIGESVSMEVLKRAERENCLVCRLVETRGCRATARLEGVGKNLSIRETDMLEWRDGVEQDPTEKPEVELQPFEIRTFKVIDRR